jgi:hypothetical protein
MKNLFLKLTIAASAIVAPFAAQAQYAMPSSTYPLLNAVVITNGSMNNVTSGANNPSSTNFAKIYAPQTLLSAQGGTNLAVQLFRGRGLGLLVNYAPLSNTYGGLILTLGTSQDGTNWAITDLITNTLSGSYATNLNAGLYGGTSSNNITAFTNYLATLIDNVNFIRLSSITNSGTNAAIVSVSATIFP